MQKLIDMTGKTYGKLTAIKRVESRAGAPTYLFLCGYCGTEKEIAGASVRSGRASSCGCQKAEACRQAATIHGFAPQGNQTREYAIWSGMISRCENKKVKSYKNYGGRGIVVCERWRNSFPNFLADMGLRPPGMTIDRINNDGNYEPGNCQWATRSEQAFNRRSQRMITHAGQTKSVAAWARHCGISETSMFRRFNDPTLSAKEAISSAISLRKTQEKS